MKPGDIVTLKSNPPLPNPQIGVILNLHPRLEILFKDKISYHKESELILINRI